jgi:hypothetical protein
MIIDFFFTDIENCGVVPLNDKKGSDNTRLSRKGLISCVVMGRVRTPKATHLIKLFFKSESDLTIKG